ncbi:hypothetical protein PhCBS80983_g02556 [Powellomyces hirtus]|uniref:Plasmid pRiA4b Orf3-like domain-containing protein n=1 Tax=Powellomyces hirtus TaxID=109895 RepID=A0A507E666_9FUNG|nr:hypothetical protein PhCBS80983_g02556 [Powellomyces hirtus]
MTVDISAIPTTLPAGVKAAGLDNAAIVKLPEEDKDIVLSNSDVYPAHGQAFLASLFFEDASKKATLRGPLGDHQTVELASGKGIDFAYTFHAQQHKLFDNEEEFPGFWKGLVQFSKFRWVVRELSASTEAEYNAAVEKAAAAKTGAAEDDGAKLFEQASAAIKAGNNLEAIALLTRAFITCELSEEVDEDVDDDPHASLRLKVLAARAQASFNLKAYRAAVRDGEMVERIYGRPMEALNDLEQADTGVYFQSILTSAQANQALGNNVDAGSGYMAIMILKMIAEQNGEIAADGEEAPEPVAPELAAELIKAAETGLAAQEDDNTHTVYRLKISLLGVSPEVWRTLEVTASTTFADLREYITMAFGWCGAPNTHEFEVYDHGLVRFTTIPEDFVVPDDEEDIDERLEICEDEDATTVGMAVSQVGDTFTYIYEKGDWVHQITVEEVRQEEIKEEECCGGHDEEDDEHEHDHAPDFPKLIAGARACPPDEVGGPAGYQEFLKAASGTPTDRWTDRIAALTFASENVGFSNNGLDSWGGAQKHSFEAMLTGSEIEELGEEEAAKAAPEPTEKDLAKGGWDAEAFDLDEAQKALATIAAMMENPEDDDWEDEDDEDDEEAEEDL